MLCNKQRTLDGELLTFEALAVLFSYAEGSTKILLGNAIFQKTVIMLKIMPALSADDYAVLTVVEREC